MAVYPLYYLYICKLTSEKPFTFKNYWVLLPALLIALLSFTFYGMMSESERLRFVENYFYNSINNYELSFAEIGQQYRIKITQLVFVFQLFPVLYYGLKKLSKFNKEVNNFYSNTENKTLAPIKDLLILFIVFTFFSAVANYLGKSFFIQEPWLLLIPSILFSILLFSISYTGYKQDFTAYDFHKETEKSTWKKTEANPDTTTEILKEQLHYLMEEKQLFRQKDLHITDIALKIGSNRTYISNCINNKLNLSFSDYINSYRIKYAQSLMTQTENVYSQIEISELSGFANETSFYRNFKKLVGMTPKEWCKQQSANSEIIKELINN